MKSKASYFSISIPLIKENLRRFWAIPAIGFLAYFLSSVFPILMSYNHINSMYGYIQMCLTNQQPFFMCVHLILPIITAVIVYRYIQSSSSVTAMHSMPFTRSQLFNSSLASGLLLIVLPLLANGLILLLIAKPTYDYSMYIDYEKMTALTDNAVDIFTRINVLNWLWQSIIVVLVIYAISIFAGMVTGNAVMHFSLAFGFNFLAPALYLTFITYCSDYLFGFTSEGVHQNILVGLSPYTEVFVSDGKFSPPLQLYYIIASLVLIIICAVLYQKRQMENSGESIVFKFMVPTICYLIAYFGMSLMGYYFSALSSNNDSQNSDVYFYAGLIAGAVISFIIGRMIVLKTPRIFNIQSLKSFGLYAIIAALFVCSITLDLMGFENRIPSASKIRGVSSTNFDFSDDGGRYSLNLFRSPTADLSEQDNSYYSFKYSDPQNIEALMALHQEIVNKKDKIQEEQKRNVQTFSINLFYNISHPLGLQRTYTLTYDRILKNKYLKQLYESLEFKSYFSFSNLNYKNINSLTLENIYFYDDNTAAQLVITDSNKISSLLKAMEKDFQNRLYEDAISRKHAYCTINIDLNYLDMNDKLQKNSFNTKVLLTDTETIKWLKDNGYAAYLECSADMVAEIVFTEYDSEKEIDYSATVQSKDILNEESEKQLVITDKKQIQEILDNYSSYQYDYDKYYQGYIVYNRMNGYSQAYSDTIFFETNNAPHYITEFFQK